MGRDIAAINSNKELTKFQPTRPHGARPPTPEDIEAMRKVSTHAPAWGAT